jgi:hypothetical protein
MNDSTASDSIYSHKDSVTFNNNQPLRYVEAPEFVDPVIISSPIYSSPINPDYIKLAEIAFNAVLQTMMEGEKKHGADEWKEQTMLEHKMHIAEHFYKINSDKLEDHIAHAMTRCAMIKYLEAEK